ncbi:DUF2157 domain-containing protein [Flavobacterium sp. Sd200]|uniref:DUF2157 domain-containing protein n=1 Tax=Flavobacterium sp. Sd200 TaxID=2692211 RepID=UPI00136929FB|nr:DUF2157 domain-containing protein [Flavobacterium sp. Sd200]MXN92056.1 DUF2157 domain-containing protein [Flavobacterium sp. Sd200]
MKDINREDIYIIKEQINLTQRGTYIAFKENIYSNKEAWQQFLRMLIISLGVGFTVLGILFFFAYNWDNLSKFIKLGLMEGLIIATTGLALIPKINSNIKNIILTGSSVLVGVLFAVFGQIYQTGANAYDFFLAWTVFITLWVLVSNFAPLWLLYLVLINTAIMLYSEQVATNWPQDFVYTLLFGFNTAVLIGFYIFSHYFKKVIPQWLFMTTAVAAVSYATFGNVIGIFNGGIIFTILIATTILVYALGIWHAFNKKSIFYIALIALSLIIIISAFLLRVFEIGMLLFSCMFIIIAISIVVKGLVDINKKWKNEE